MLLETAQLRTFVAIVETGSFTKAAAKVNLTQPAVSLHIKRLEEQLMRKLFERDGRGVVLTQDGRTLLGFAKKIMALHGEAESVFASAELAGRVRLGAPEYFDSKVLTMLVAHFGRRHPGVELDIKIALGPDVKTAIEGGELDVGIVNSEPGQSCGPLLDQDNRIWVAAADFKPVSGKPLPLVLFPNSCEWRKLATGLLDEEGIAWSAVLTSGGVTGLVAGIEAGLGISVFPEKGLPSTMEDVGALLGLPALPAFEYWLYESHFAPPAARRLAFIIKEVFGQKDRTQTIDRS
jgi:DNA-binding transcriptional LysR family regulator